MKHYEAFELLINQKDNLKEKISLKRLEKESQNDFSKRLKEHSENMSEQQKKQWFWIKQVEKFIEETYWLDKNLRFGTYENIEETSLDIIFNLLNELNLKNEKIHKFCRMLANQFKASRYAREIRKERVEEKELKEILVNQKQNHEKLLEKYTK